MSYPRGTHDFIKQYWQFSVEDLPMPVVYGTELAWRLGHLVGSVMSDDPLVNGMPLIHHLDDQGRPSETVGGVGCSWSTDGKSFDMAFSDN